MGKYRPIVELGGADVQLESVLDFCDPLKYLGSDYWLLALLFSVITNPLLACCIPASPVIKACHLSLRVSSGWNKSFAGGVDTNWRELANTNNPYTYSS